MKLSKSVKISTLPTRELQAIIDSYHKERDYDSFFERVARELNARKDSQPRRNAPRELEPAQTNVTVYHTASTAYFYTPKNRVVISLWEDKNELTDAIISEFESCGIALSKRDIKHERAPY